MKKSLMITSFFIGGLAVLLSVLFLFGFFSRPHPTAVSEFSSSCPRSLEIETIASDIIVEQGDSFRIEYLLSGKERIGRFEFSDDVFTFSTAGKFFGFPSFNKERFVKVTVPESFIFSSVALKTVSGNIRLICRSVISFAEGRFETVSGDCFLNETAFRTAAVKTVSGQIVLNPHVSERCTLKSVSGAVDIRLKEKVSVEVESYGSVSVYGEDFGNHAVVRFPDSPTITAESVSGHITVTDDVK